MSLPCDWFTIDRTCNDICLTCRRSEAEHLNHINICTRLLNLSNANRRSPISSSSSSSSVCGSNEMLPQVNDEVSRYIRLNASDQFDCGTSSSSSSTKPLRMKRSICMGYHRFHLTTQMAKKTTPQLHRRVIGRREIRLRQQVSTNESNQLIATSSSSMQSHRNCTQWTTTATKTTSTPIINNRRYRLSRNNSYRKARSFIILKHSNPKHSINRNFRIIPRTTIGDHHKRIGSIMLPRTGRWCHHYSSSCCSYCNNHHPHLNHGNSCLSMCSVTSNSTNLSDSSYCSPSSSSISSSSSSSCEDDENGQSCNIDQTKLIKHWHRTNSNNSSDDDVSIVPNERRTSLTMMDKISISNKGKYVLSSSSSASPSTSKCEHHTTVGCMQNKPTKMISNGKSHFMGTDLLLAEYVMNIFNEHFMLIQNVLLLQHYWRI